uniref:Protein VAC14 homolog n=1 Tax=Timema monikensis TaxID=170555 RepID=A0A7R9EF77_9NEOP|nr:unnamed protein product [Timema monikensis]
MSGKDHAPLSSACVRALNDKIYEKRKAAAQEIEKMVKDFSATKNTLQITKLLKVLGQDFALSQNPNTRKGGLIGLAAIAVALGKFANVLVVLSSTAENGEIEESSLYTGDLIHPILACFADSDPLVRYYACESLYNVSKVARGSVLVHFTDIFSVLSKLAADPDQKVRSGSEHLDKLMKDIVTESAAFDLVGLMPHLRKKIYSNNTFARQFIISWVSVLDAVPDIDLIVFLPEILDGLFRILEDPNKEIQKMCDTVLNEFLRSIKKDPSRVKFDEMINILITHSQSPDELLQETAKAVNFTFMKLVTEGDDKDSFLVEVVGDVMEEEQLDLPSLVDVLTKHLHHTSVATKVSVLRWIYHLYIKIPTKHSQPIMLVAKWEEQIAASVQVRVEESAGGKMVERQRDPATDWKRFMMFLYIEKLFPELRRALSDSSDEVVQQDLEVLAEIISSPSVTSSSDDADSENQLPSNSHGMNPYFSKFVISLLKLFSSDRHLLEDRGSFIIRQLCILLNSEDIYTTLSMILKTEENVKFASIMVENLNTILLTSSELFDLRMKLKDMNTEESYKLFRCLYESWCHDPVATVALCLLTQNYSHACDLIRTLFESPGCGYHHEWVQACPDLCDLRLELLEVPHNQHLVQALYGLLMLLPQTEAFHTLRRRLDCVPSLHLHCARTPVAKTEVCNKHEKHINFDELLAHFLSVQERHHQTKQSSRAVTLLEKGVRNLDT